MCGYSLCWSGVLTCRHSALDGAKVYPRLCAVVSRSVRVFWAASCPVVAFLYEVTSRMSSTYVRMRLVAAGKLVVAMAAMALMLTRNSIGDSGEPSGVPLSVAKAFEFFPLKRYDVARLVPQCSTHCARCWLFLAIVQQTLSSWRWSKPPSMSSAMRQVYDPELFVMVSLRAWMASVVRFCFLPPYIMFSSSPRSAILCTTALSRILASMLWSCMGLQLFATVYVTFFAFGIRMVLLALQVSGMPWVQALFIILRKRSSRSLQSSFISLVVMWSGQGAAPFGDCLIAALRMPVLSGSAFAVMWVLVLWCSPP